MVPCGRICLLVVSARVMHCSRKESLFSIGPNTDTASAGAPFAAALAGGAFPFAGGALAAGGALGGTLGTPPFSASSSLLSSSTLRAWKARLARSSRWISSTYVEEVSLSLNWEMSDSPGSRHTRRSMAAEFFSCASPSPLGDNEGKPSTVRVSPDASLSSPYTYTELSASSVDSLSSTGYSFRLNIYNENNQIKCYLSSLTV